MSTLAEVTSVTGFAVLEHLEAEAEVPVIGGLQAQGDLLIIPRSGAASTQPVPAEGVAVIDPVGSGHEHRLFAGTPGTAMFTLSPPGTQDIGTLTATEPCYILHPEHGATGIAPGTYTLRRQREQAADEQRLVAD